MRTALIVAVGALALIGLMILAARRADRNARETSAAATTTLSVAQAMETRVRTLLRNERADDEAREAILRSEMTARRLRCDRMTIPVMANPGTWRVVCTPGYAYTFYFDGADPMVRLTTIVPD